MAVSTGSSRLYREGRAQFVKDCEARYSDSKDLEMLRDFLAQQGTPEEARAAAGNLRADAGKKWGSRKVGDTEIPGAWIDKIMSNIGNFVEVGNYAMTGAPESVGLAWFAVKLTLSAIQSNYDLYTFFGSGLTDISEIMIIIPHYDRLYDERDKAKTNKGEWKPSPIIDKLYQDIVSTYAAVLSFSFSVRRHLSAGTLAKLRHGFKDFWGASKGKFSAKIDTIAALKKKILEGSQAIFQDKTMQNFDAVKGIMSNIEGTVNQIKDFQSTLQKMHEEQAAQWQLVLKKMEDIKATTKPKTPWDLALQEWEKNKEALNPQKDTSDALGIAIDQRHPSTCQWIFEHSAYTEWNNSTSNGLLCLSGQQGFGKSIVLATVVEQLGLSDNTKSTLIYLSCGSKGGGPASRAAPSVDDICHTLLYQLYHLAREDENNVKLLEDCNKVFKNPKASKIGSAIARSNKDEKLPEFADAFSTIAERLKIDVVVALDEVNNLSPKDQQELASKLEAVLNPSEEPTTDGLSIKVIVGCRSGTKFHNQVQSMEDLTYSVDVGDFNKEDIAKKLSDDLKHVPGLAEAEQEEAKNAILDKAGSRFAYIDDIAMPFMREPFQRPLSRRLQFLPEGMNNIYNEALRRMGSNYVDLLHTALTWALLAPNPPKVQEIMDAYHGTYSDRGPEVETEARALEDTKFGEPAELEIEQLRDASGPFLRLEHESRTNDYFVNLQDPPRIREFCLHSVDSGASEGHKENDLCARCKGALAESKSLTISPKEGHLELALACLRHLNNPIFQRRVTASDDVPLWSQSANAEDSKTEEHDTQLNGDGGASAEGPPLEDDSKSNKDQSSPEEAENLPNGESKPITDDDHVDEHSEEVESAEQKPKEDTAVDDSGYDSDESMDDEDRGEINLAKALESGNAEEVEDGDVDVRQGRYELYFWSYHVRQAEELWTPEERAESNTWADLMKELDHFVSANLSFFNRWQKVEETIANDHDHLDPLHVAAYFGLTSWAQHLLKKGADPNELSGSPIAKSALQVAAIRADSRPMLKLLLENGADPNLDSDGTLPAFHHWLLNDASMETVQLLLKHGANPTVSDKANQWTALHYFAWGAEDNVEVLETLLNHVVDGVKPDINALDDEKHSPLHVLLWRREVPKKLLQAFIDHDADVNSEDDRSTRPLQMASVWGELETLKILSHGKSIKDIDDPDADGDSALYQAVLGSHPNCLKFLIELGGNPNMQNNMKRVALHGAAWPGSKECVEILLANGAHLNMLDQHDRTPFFFACLGDSIEIPMLLLEALLEKKVPMKEINALTKRRRSPLRQAAGKGFEEIVDKLIKSAQAENDLTSLAINEPDSLKGMTALHRAAWFGRAGCVRLLLDAKADVNIRDKNGKTALVLAYEQWALASHENAFEEIISMLIAGAPEAATADAELVAICAINGSTRLLQQLSTMGTDLNRQDRYGWTPLELARKFNQEAAGQYLKQQAAWAGMLPSRWAVDTRTEVAEDGKSVNHTSGERVCVSTDKPLPAGLDTFYFEVTSKPLVEAVDQPEWPILALGFCTIGGKAVRFPGWPPRQDAPSAKSWGYHGDDGGLFDSSNEDGSPVANDLPYQPGHTVGCGVDLTTRTIWFTRNGQMLEGKFENVQGRLFPLLGLKDGVELETNFTGPFLWKGAEAVEKDDAKEKTMTNGAGKQEP